MQDLNFIQRLSVISVPLSPLSTRIKGKKQNLVTYTRLQTTHYILRVTHFTPVDLTYIYSTEAKRTISESGKSTSLFFAKSQGGT